VEIRPATRAISRKRRCASSLELSEASTSCSRSGAGEHALAGDGLDVEGLALTSSKP
jgi:hypothetical protein